jgi:hypothetical protein
MSRHGGSTCRVFGFLVTEGFYDPMDQRLGIRASGYSAISRLSLLQIASAEFSFAARSQISRITDLRNLSDGIKTWLDEQTECLRE